MNQQFAGKRVFPAVLEAFCIEALVKAGMSAEHAGMTARALVTTDTWGIHTHGTYQLVYYIQKMRAGGINPQAVPKIATEGPGWAILDGNAAIAMVNGTVGMDVAMKKAESAGIGYVGIRNSNHFGAAGYYAHLAAERGMIGLAMSNLAPVMAAPGSRGRVIGNNPFAYAVPAGKEPSLLFDVATSVTSGVKVEIAKAQGKAIPNDWIIDEEGVPTTDLSKFPHGITLLPMAGHKGYGIAVMVEVLAAVLTGAGITAEVPGWSWDMPNPTNTGHAVIAINIETMMPLEQFKERMDRMILRTKQSPKAKGSERIYLPGEMEWEKRNEALEHGMLLPERLVSNLSALAQENGLDLEKLFQ
jgi:LDH2 family malate/lactate/ureidoglycolate dehydrogenase